MSFLYDLHVHTSEVSPCGQIPAAEMVELYAEAGYAGIAITDHYYDGYFQTISGTWGDQVERYLQGYKYARKRGEELGLDVLLGLELRFADNPEDFLVYGVDEEFLHAFPRLFNLGLTNFAKLAKEHNLLVIQAHPFRPGLQVAEPSLLEGIEVYNGNPRHNSRNDLALAYAQKHRLMQVGCSDAHRYEDVAVAGLEFPRRVKTAQELVATLRENPILPRTIKGQRGTNGIL